MIHLRGPYIGHIPEKKSFPHSELHCLIRAIAKRSLKLSLIPAHPNVKLFISHGGLLGTSEAVHEGVPVLGIPIVFDQPTNIEAIEANGAGERLDYTDISEEVVYEKLSRLLNDPK